MTLTLPTRKANASAVCALILVCAAIPARAQQDSGDAVAKKPATTKTANKAGTTQATRKHSPRKKKSVKARGQQKIDSERATSIQEALIREHYLSGTASGTWNQSSEDAMRRYQADHGWQTKEVPDSRARIKLGLSLSRYHPANQENSIPISHDAKKGSSMPT